MFHGSNYLGSMEALSEVPISLFAAFIELRDRAETLGGAPPSPPPRPSPPRAPAARATRHGTCPPGESRRRIGRHGPGIAQTPAGARRATPPTRESPCTPTRVPVRNPHASPNDRKAAPTPPRVPIHPTRIRTPTNPAPAPNRTSRTRRGHPDTCRRAARHPQTATARSRPPPKPRAPPHAARYPQPTSRLCPRGAPARHPRL